MSSGINKVVLLGYLTRDPEYKQTESGTKVCTMPIGVTTEYIHNKEKRQDTVFVDIVTFGNLAETCSKKLARGNGVVVDGKLHINSWVNASGVRQKITQIIASTINFLPKKTEETALGDTGYVPEIE